MDLLLQQLSDVFRLQFPKNWMDWCLFCLWLTIFLYSCHYHYQNQKVVEKNPVNWVFYSFLTIICSSLFKVEIFPFHIQVFPSADQQTGEFFFLVFQMLPWMVAAVFGKSILSIFLAILGSTIFCGFYSHNVFFILLIGSLSSLLNIFMNQKNGILRKYQDHPILLISITIIISLPLFYLERFTSIESSIALRLDSCLHDGWISYLSRTLELLLAGFVAELLVQRNSRRVEDTVSESSDLKKKKIALPLVGLFYSTLFILTILWNITRSSELAGRRILLNERMDNINSAILSSFTSNAIRIDQLDKKILLNGKKTEIDEIIKPLFQPVQDLDAFYLFNTQGELVYSYPYVQEEELLISDQEIKTFQITQQDNQIRGAFSSPEPSNFFMSIVYPVMDADIAEERILLAIIDIRNNPTYLPIRTLMEGYQNEGLEIAFVNTRFDTRLAWEIDEQTESTSHQFISSIYFPMELDGWGIEISLKKQAFLEGFYAGLLPYLLTTLLSSILVGGIYYLRWANLEKAVLDLSVRFSYSSSEENRSQRESSYPPVVVEFLRVLRRIFQGLDERYQQQQTYLELWQNYADPSGYKELLKNALKPFANSDTLFVKVLLDDSLTGSPPDEYCYSLIENLEEYQYLDEQIQKVLEEQDQLVIGNTSRFHQIVRAIGKPFPPALLIKKMKIDQERSAVFWIAYRTNQDFSTEYMQDFLEKFECFAQHIKEIEKMHRWLREKNILSQLFDEMDYPVFIFINKMLWYGNKAGALFLKIDGVEEHTLIAKRVQENEIYNIFLRNKFQPHVLLSQEMNNGEKYEIDIRNSHHPDIGEVSILLLKDITHEKKREEITRDYITMLSHELRSPVAIIQGYSKMLPMVGELNATQQDYLNKVKNGLEIVTSLIEGILLEDRIENGIQLSQEEINIQELLEEIKTQLESLANQKRVKIDLLPTGSEIIINADRVLTKQVFYNLMQNAIKYSEMEGTVEIEMSSNESETTVTIKDCGPGIASIDIPFVFEKYYHPKGSGEAVEKQGGMGLYLAKFIMDAQGGKINVDSELGKGTTISVSFPATNGTT